MSNDIPTQVPEPELLSARELALALGVTSATVRRWVRTGHLKPTNITYGGYYQFDVEDAKRQLDALRFIRKHPETRVTHPDEPEHDAAILDTDE